MNETASGAVGVIGVGTIGEAMVDGFLFGGKQDLPIVLSPRGAEAAARLLTRHPRSVALAASNQEVVDRCGTVILAVRPAIAREVLSTLAFRNNHHLISVVAGLTRPQLLVFAAPVQEVTLAIPLPAMARGNAPTVLLPPNIAAATLFRRGGPVTEVEDERAFAALGTSTAIMASHFAMARAVSDWLARNRVPEGASRAYVAQLIQGLTETAQLRENDSFASLEEYHATAGSFNDALRTRLRDAKAFEVLQDGLDDLIKRMLGEPN